MGKTLLCRDCGEWLLKSEFYTESTKRGYTKRCKICFDSYVEYKTLERRVYCHWCFGYGVSPWDGRPLGIHEVKRDYPAKDCPICKANYQLRRRSKVDPAHNPFYKW